MLRLAHAPNQRCRLLLGKLFRNTFQLLAGDSAHPFDLVGRPLRNLLAHLVASALTLTAKFLVVPAVLKNVLQRAPSRRLISHRRDDHLMRSIPSSARLPPL